MRKLFALLIVLTIVPLTAVADADLSSMSVDELTKLRNAINLELAARSSLPDNAVTWTTPLARIDLVSVTKGTSKDGAACVEVILEYTNLNDAVDNFRSSHWVTLYQCGVEQKRTVYFNDKLCDTDSWDRKTQPGATCLMQWVFLVPNESDTIDLEVEFRSNYKSESAGIFTVSMPD